MGRPDSMNRFICGNKITAWKIVSNSIFRFRSREINRLREHVAFKNLAQRLASYQRVLIHRDFQLAEYHRLGRRKCILDRFPGSCTRANRSDDLASLLFDPYVTLTDQECDTSVEILLCSGMTTAGRFQSLSASISSAGFNV